MHGIGVELYATIGLVIFGFFGPVCMIVWLIIYVIRRLRRWAIRDAQREPK